jgi:nucleotide-binding universal stress UspA family protein
MTKRIIVPVDGSEHSLKALDVAADIARQRGHSVCLMHVIPGGGTPSGLEQWAAAEHVHESPQWLYDEGIGENVLASAVARLSAQGEVKTEEIIEHGDPARRVIEASAGDDVAMVVMGSRGLSDFAGLVLGSVAHKVAHSAKCPVVTVT